MRRLQQASSDSTSLTANGASGYASSQPANGEIAEPATVPHGAQGLPVAAQPAPAPAPHEANGVPVPAQPAADQTPAANNSAACIAVRAPHILTQQSGMARFWLPLSAVAERCQHAGLFIGRLTASSRALLSQLYVPTFTGGLYADNCGIHRQSARGALEDNCPYGDP